MGHMGGQNYSINDVLLNCKRTFKDLVQVAPYWSRFFTRLYP